MPTNASNDEVSPLNFYVAAKEYLEAAKTIWFSPGREHLGLGKFFLPTHMLLGFAMELFLKAWLRHRGMATAVLRSKQYGHDLKVLYTRSQEHGLPSNTGQAELVEHLAAEHSAYGYRYVKDDHTYTLTNLPRAFAILDGLDKQVDAEIGASTSHGLTPGH